MLFSLSGCGLWGSDEEDSVPQTFCHGLDKTTVETVTGHLIFLVANEEVSPPPHFDQVYGCFIDLKEFGNIRISYNPEPTFYNSWSGFLDATEAREKWSKDKTFEELDLGLEGVAYYHSYGSLLADAAWFAPNNSTLQVELISNDVPNLTETEVRKVVVGMMRYVSSVYPKTFPPPPTPTQSATPSPQATQPCPRSPHSPSATPTEASQRPKSALGSSC
ncbi:hypothetical protein [Actinomyces bovis]|uniref:hypothetical protein n=1 Tax=Actinomyces bovis TaxID=1658 RepID=UPI000F81770D|nr:hypothetical protein [Actinomyces bovis]